jgi:ubiquinone/menaquinone biosynthesis C-methylase UbiE
MTANRPMTQNIYDNESFFAEYSRLARSVKGLDGAPEWPALRAMLPDLQGSRVLDLGCGFGWFCRWAREYGAAEVWGLDISEKMLARAQAMTMSAAITYKRADLDRIELPSESYNLVYSSLAFHYLENLERLMAEIHRSLIPGGSLVFSVEHPIYTSPSDPKWLVNERGYKTWPVDGYLNEGARSTRWLSKTVIKQHRTVGTYLNILIQLGFALHRIEEWGPTQEQIESEPSWADERERPPFMLVAAIRP